MRKLLTAVLARLAGLLMKRSSSASSAPFVTALGPLGRRPAALRTVIRDAPPTSGEPMPAATVRLSFYGPYQRGPSAPARSSQPTEFSLNARRRNGDTVITISGEIDITSRWALRAEMLRALHPPEPRILLELSGVTFLDCAGLSALLEARRWAELRGGSLHLIAVSRPVHRVITLTGLQNAFLPPWPADPRSASNR